MSCMTLSGAASAVHQVPLLPLSTGQTPKMDASAKAAPPEDSTTWQLELNHVRRDLQGASHPRNHRPSDRSSRGRRFEDHTPLDDLAHGALGVLHLLHRKLSSFARIESILTLIHTPCRATMASRPSTLGRRSSRTCSSSRGTTPASPLSLHRAARVRTVCCHILARSAMVCSSLSCLAVPSVSLIIASEIDCPAHERHQLRAAGRGSAGHRCVGGLRHMAVSTHHFLNGFEMPNQCVSQPEHHNLLHHLRRRRFLRLVGRRRPVAMGSRCRSIHPWL